jgi:nucleoside-diphosphate-sugar epimerase
MNVNNETFKPLPTVLVTGANGFIGKPLLNIIKKCDRFLAKGVVRRAVDSQDEGLVVPLLDGSTDWRSNIGGIDAVVHLAARVHVMEDAAADPLAEFRKVNVEGTLALARQAAEAGVRRFVFLSSIKVNGEQTQTGRPYTPNDSPKPTDPYGLSKCEAEAGLQRIAERTGMEVVVLRSVLVYGPGVKGNFLSMLRWLRKGLPLPLGAINNVRSLVALDNLVDLIVTCLHHPAAANQTFLVSDGEDLSTTMLLKRIALAMGIKARLIPVPASILQAGARLLGKGDVARRLCGNLQVDITKTRQLLGWSPPVSVADGIVRTVRWFNSAENTAHLA